MISRQTQTPKKSRNKHIMLPVLALIIIGISALTLFKFYIVNGTKPQPSPAGNSSKEKKEIKVKVVDDYNFLKNGLIYKILEKNYNIVESEEPDYLLYSVFGNKNLDYKDCVRVFWTGENIAPDVNLCDYAVSFEYMNYLDRNIRVPFWLFGTSATARMQNKHKIDKNFLNSKTDFCSFIYSNGGADQIRKNFFESLCSKYKKVNSGGMFLNNIGGNIGKDADGSDSKQEFERKHKFSIAFENSSHPGYSTEKLAEAFAAQTIPIYWGDPTIGETFNTKAFINVHDYNSIDEVIDKIIEIDNNDSLYLQMMQQPALIDESYVDTTLASLESFLKNIFDQDYAKAFRRNTGVWGENYFNKMRSLRDAGK